MNAFLFAAAFLGVLAVSSGAEREVEPVHVYGADYAMNAADEPFMARGELRDTNVSDWTVSVIGSAE